MELQFEKLAENVLKKAKLELKGPSYALLEAELTTKNVFRGFKKTKTDLETLLAYAVCVLEFKTKDGETKRMLCCSNVRFVNMFKAIKKTDVEKALKSPYEGMRTRDSLSVMTYDLVEGKIKTVLIPPGTWYVPHAWMFSDKTVPALAPLIKECLKA